LLQLLHHQPLQADVQALLNHWYYFYERSIGCVGVLKDWLVRAVAAALREDDRHLSLARVQAHALSNAQCESMAANAHAAEQKLHYTESSREHLWSLLGTEGQRIFSGSWPLGRLDCRRPRQDPHSGCTRLH
jgi:hypothetical protein